MVSDCYSTGTIHTVQASSLAGIVAHMETYASTVARCYTTAILIADGAKRSGMHEGVGGVVGVTSGVVQDAIALNKRITAKSADNVGRVGGKTVSTVAGEPLFEGSASWIMMPVNDGVRNDSTGQSYSAAQFKEPERWQAFQDSALWTYSGGGSLPVPEGNPCRSPVRRVAGGFKRRLRGAVYEGKPRMAAGVYHITDPAQLRPGWL